MESIDGCSRLFQRSLVQDDVVGYFLPLLAARLRGKHTFCLLDGLGVPLKESL